MNDLSWMLYWADVLPNMATSISVMAFVILILGAIGAAVFLMVAAGDSDFDGIRPEVTKRLWMLGACAAALVLVQAVPSRDTFYAIAASEMGEEALKSPIATKAGKALEKWLDKQVGEESEKGK